MHGLHAGRGDDHRQRDGLAEDGRGQVALRGVPGHVRREAKLGESGDVVLARLAALGAGHQRAVHRRRQALARAPLRLGHRFKPGSCHGDQTFPSVRPSVRATRTGPPGDDRRDGHERPLAQAAGPDAGAVADVVGDVGERVPHRVERGRRWAYPVSAGPSSNDAAAARLQPCAAAAPLLAAPLLAVRPAERLLAGACLPRDAAGAGRGEGDRQGGRGELGRVPADAEPGLPDRRSAPRQVRRRLARRRGVPPTRCPARPLSCAAVAAAGRRASAAPTAAVGQGWRTRGARFAGWRRASGAAEVP